MIGCGGVGSCEVACGLQEGRRLLFESKPALCPMWPRPFTGLKTVQGLRRAHR